LYRPRRRSTTASAPRPRMEARFLPAGLRGEDEDERARSEHARDGGDGTTSRYNLVGGTSSDPAYAAVTPAGQSKWTFTTSTTDPRALQTADGPARPPLDGRGRDPGLARFDHRLGSSELGHYRVFLRLAGRMAPHPDVEGRWREMSGSRRTRWPPRPRACGCTAACPDEPLITKSCRITAWEMRPCSIWATRREARAGESRPDAVKKHRLTISGLTTYRPFGQFRNR
jgi:hypothetical protein